MKKLIIASLLACGFGAAAIADDTDICAPDDDSFASQVGRPVTISYHQPIKGVEEQVLTLDKWGQIEDYLWQPFFNSDVLVFFYSSADELEFMPAPAYRLMNIENDPLSEGLTFRHAKLTNGDNRLMVVVMVEGYVQQSYEKFIENIDSMIYWTITQSPSSSFRKYLKACGN